MSTVLSIPAALDLAAVDPAGGLAALAGSAIVIEAIVEDLAVKRMGTVLRILDRLEDWYRDGHYRASPLLRRAALAELAGDR